MVKNKLESAKEHNESVRRIKESAVTTIRTKIREKVEFIEAEESFASEIDVAVTNLISTISDKKMMKSRLDQYKTLMNDLSSKVNAINKDIKFYTLHDNCPTCKQGIDHDFKQHTLDGKSSKSSEIDSAIDQLKSKVNNVSIRLEEISDVESNIQTKTLEANDHRANIRIAKSVLQGLAKELKSAEQAVEEVDNLKIQEYKEELDEFQNAQKILHEDKETLAVVGSMLKDGGIKTRIIKQYVPIMNKLINKYLAAMDFFVDFQLDESFSEKILSRFRDEFSYASFSEGEKLRIDLALMFTWRAVSRLRNSVTTNLLIMDEVLDGSLDQTGTDEFLKIINELTADSNVFIISHKGDSLYDKFDHVLKFEKVKNFSQIAA